MCINRALYVFVLLRFVVFRCPTSHAISVSQQGTDNVFKEGKQCPAQGLRGILEGKAEEVGCASDRLYVAFKVGDERRFEQAKNVSRAGRSEQRCSFIEDVLANMATVWAELV